MKTKTKFLKLKPGRRDQAKVGIADTEVNDASSIGQPKHKFGSSPFGHSNFGRNISPDAGKSGVSKKQSSHDTNPVGGIGKGKGMGIPVMSGSARKQPLVGTAQDVVPIRKKINKGKPKYLNTRGMQHK